jgi:hypothetical protein
MATVQLRLSGVTPLHLGAAAISTAPILFVGWEMLSRHAHPTLPLALLSAAVALLPWISRAGARASYRAKCDEIAVHVRGEALPYKTISEVALERTARRHVLHLRRSETVQIDLVLWDAFAGRLEPWEELDRRLRAHGLVVQR